MLTTNARTRHRGGDDVSVIFYDRFGRPVLNAQPSATTTALIEITAGDVSRAESTMADIPVIPVCRRSLMWGRCSVALAMDDGTDRAGDSMPGRQTRPFTGG